ncbi:MAG: iron-sulfur cluster assembly scaffold protein [Pseudomonadota bacterium]
MSDLYHNRVLELAADIPHLAPLDAPEGSVEKVSRICGSTVRVDVRLNPAGSHVEAISVDPKACALGQAATAILAEGALGASIAEITAARDALKAMLKENAAPPGGRFWELRHLAGVADYPPRHTSTLLAFEAAVAAINAALDARETRPVQAAQNISAE